MYVRSLTTHGVDEMGSVAGRQWRCVIGCWWLAVEKGKGRAERIRLALVVVKENAELASQCFSYVSH